MRTQEPFLPLLHLPAITAALAHGEKCTVIGSQFGISAARIRMFARVNGYALTRGPNRSSDVSRAMTERNAEIIRLREGGAYYVEIGKQFGVTGERVRQVLRTAGRADLAGWGTLRARHTVTAICAACGAAFSHQASQKSNYCGRECRNRHAGVWAPRIPEILAMRRGG
ncbi:MAG: hypothetical protein KGL35_02460, partial [Bradyrhizobium sp.]|nr:hypothetical protein [Bradyrhizobium sp.]